MSLDIYLTLPGAQAAPGSGIFIRDNGGRREISRNEWDDLYPGLEPVVCAYDSDEVYSANITHNLGRMAGEAALYQPLWRPDELGITRAGALIELLETGLALLRSDPERFRQFNPANGWGDYEGLERVTAGYLDACRQYPDAKVSVSR